MMKQLELDKKSTSLGFAGLGFRREMLPDLRKISSSVEVDFFEIAPENWLSIGGRFARDLREFTERFAFTCHGLSLSVGGYSELDTVLLKNIKLTQINMLIII